MHYIENSIIIQYQQNTFRLTQELHLNTIDDAKRYIDERGFIFFWPISGFRFPSLWTATAGDRPVADEHDDPGHKSWGWKDEGLDKKLWYYGRIIKKRNLFISLDCLPFFFALSPNYGNPKEDIQDLYEQGKISLEARLIFSALSDYGPLDTITLRKKARLESESSQSPFNRALATLQEFFFIQPVGVSQAGAWRYAFVYDLTIRNHPEIIEKSRFITEQDARLTMLRYFFLSIGAASIKQVTGFFSWTTDVTTILLTSLVEEKFLVSDVAFNSNIKSAYSLSKLVPSSIQPSHSL